MNSPRVVSIDFHADAAAVGVVLLVPLQMLAYYIAVRRCADVDRPRNLAKLVTVE